jgi:hypothetical protein
MLPAKNILVNIMEMEITAVKIIALIVQIQEWETSCNSQMTPATSLKG